ncbi:MAG: TetR/AcrR family transcriptional regulator [Rhodocyclaceae bacterium]
MVQNSHMSSGRPIEFDRDQAIEAAMEVFWRQGYEATSLADLLAAMGLSKSSLYQAFGSKQKLFETCLAHFRERQTARMTRALEAAPSAMAFLRQMLHGVAREARARPCPKGCLIMNSATEFAGRDPAIARLVERGVGDFTAVFRAAIRRAQSEGDVPAARSADTLARYIVSTISGLKTMIKAGASARSVEDIAEVALGALR